MEEHTAPRYALLSILYHRTRPQGELQGGTTVRFRRPEIMDGCGWDDGRGIDGRAGVRLGYG